jgi:hypothetical protein
MYNYSNQDYEKYKIPTLIESPLRIDNFLHVFLLCPGSLVLAAFGISVLDPSYH